MSISVDGKFHFGETWQFIGHARDEYSNPLDLTGATVSLKITTQDPLATFLSLSTPATGSITNATEGEYLFLVTPSQQSALTSTALHYTVQIVLADSVTTIQNTGELTILSDDFNQIP